MYKYIIAQYMFILYVEGKIGRYSRCFQNITFLQLHWPNCQANKLLLLRSDFQCFESRSHYVWKAHESKTWHISLDERQTHNASQQRCTKVMKREQKKKGGGYASWAGNALRHKWTNFEIPKHIYLYLVYQRTAKVAHLHNFMSPSVLLPTRPAHSDTYIQVK